MLKLITAHRFQIWDWTGFLPSPKMIQGLGMGPHDQQIAAANDRNTSTKNNMWPSDFVPPMSYLLSVNVIYCKTVSICKWYADYWLLCKSYRKKKMVQTYLPAHQVAALVTGYGYQSEKKKKTAFFRS